MPRPQTGTLTPRAFAIISDLDSYTEVSPSGTGVHVWCLGTLPPGRRRTDGVELYDRSRYMSLTGWHLEGTPASVEERSAAVAALHSTTFGKIGRGPTVESDVPDERETRDGGELFKRLWNGDLTAHSGDHSAADLALCNLLARDTNGDAAKMDALFRRSGLYRPKWDEPRGDKTYGERTIAVALERYRELAARARVRPSSQELRAATGTRAGELQRTRYLLACEALSTTQERYAFRVFERAFQDFGLYGRVLSCVSADARVQCRSHFSKPPAASFPRSHSRRFAPRSLSR